LKTVLLKVSGEIAIFGGASADLLIPTAIIILLLSGLTIATPLTRRLEASSQDSPPQGAEVATHSPYKINEKSSQPSISIKEKVSKPLTAEPLIPGAPSSSKRSLTRLGLMALLAAIALSTITGIFSLLGGGAAGWQVFLTSLDLSTALLLGLGGAAAWERKKRVPIAFASTAAAVIGALGMLLLIWGKDAPGNQAEDILKISGSAWIIATCGVYLALLSFPETPGASLLLRRALDGLLVFSAALSLFMIWVDADEDLVRVLGAAGVILVLGTVALPITIRIVRSSPGALPPMGKGERPRFCPSCGAEALSGEKRLTCGACEASFELK
jgi:hypothetical protein